MPIASYDVYASVDGGPLAPWLTGTAQVQATYSGYDGRRYGFAVVAVNTLGVASATPTAPPATTQVQTSAATATMLQASAREARRRDQPLSFTATVDDYSDLGGDAHRATVQFPRRRARAAE